MVNKNQLQLRKNNNLPTYDLKQSLTLKKAFDDSTPFNQLNDLSIEQVENSKLKEVLQSMIIAAMEQELESLKTEKMA